jgi:hypothetical protein
LSTFNLICNLQSVPEIKKQSKNVENISCKMWDTYLFYILIYVTIFTSKVSYISTISIFKGKKITRSQDLFESPIYRLFAEYPTTQAGRLKVLPVI